MCISTMLQCMHLYGSVLLPDEKKNIVYIEIIGRTYEILSRKYEILSRTYEIVFQVVRRR